MKNLFMTGIFLLLFIVDGYPLGERTVAGGKPAALGGSSVALIDFWSIANNPAGSAWLKNVSAGAWFENRFLLKALLYEKFGIALPLKSGAFGLVLAHRGSMDCHEIKAGLSYGRKFGNHFSAGVTVDYFRLDFPDEYGGKNMISCEIGLMYLPNKQLVLGAHIVNPVPIKITTNPAELLPTAICLGASYRFSSSFIATLEAEKDLLHIPVFRAGAEYHFAAPVFARIGISTSPANLTFGFGLQFGRFTIDVASEYHQVLGFSPSGSIIYCFNSR